MERKGPGPTDPLVRAEPPFDWYRTPAEMPRRVETPARTPITLDPDIALWPVTPLSRWPFIGPPIEGMWPVGWMGVDATGTIYTCTVGGEPGTWAAQGGSSGQVEAVVAGTNIAVDSADPTHPVVSATARKWTEWSGGGPNSTFITATQGVDLTLQNNIIQTLVTAVVGEPAGHPILSIVASMAVQQTGTPGEDIIIDFHGLFVALGLDVLPSLFDVGQASGICSLQTSGPFGLIGNVTQQLSPTRQDGTNAGALLTATSGDWLGINIQTFLED